MMQLIPNPMLIMKKQSEHDNFNVIVLERELAQLINQTSLVNTLSFGISKSSIGTNWNLPLYLYILKSFPEYLTEVHLEISQFLCSHAQRAAWQLTLVR